MRRRLVVSLAVAVLLVALADRGFAFWQSGGSGTGTAATGTPQPVTVRAATGTPSSKLLPGSSADLVVRIDNPNAYSVTIVGIAQNGTLTVSGGTSCTAANAGVSVPAQSGLSLTVGTGTSVVHIPAGAAMGTGSDSGCQGASFRVPIMVTVQR